MTEETQFDDIALEKIINQGINNHRVFVGAKEALTALKTVKQRTLDAERRGEALRRENEEVAASTESMKADAAAVVKAADEYRKKSEAEAKSITKDAEEKASKIIEEAKEKAQKALQNASDSIEENRINSDKKLKETKELIASMQDEAIKAKKLQRENFEVKKALDEEKARLEKVKSDLLTIMNVKG